MLIMKVEKDEWDERTNNNNNLCRHSLCFFSFLERVPWLAAVNTVYWCILFCSAWFFFSSLLWFIRIFILRRMQKMKYWNSEWHIRRTEAKHSHNSALLFMTNFLFIASRKTLLTWINSRKAYKSDLSRRADRLQIALRSSLKIRKNDNVLCWKVYMRKCRKIKLTVARNIMTLFFSFFLWYSSADIDIFWRFLVLIQFMEAEISNMHERANNTAASKWKTFEMKLYSRWEQKKYCNHIRSRGAILLLSQ